MIAITGVLAAAFQVTANRRAASAPPAVENAAPPGTAVVHVHGGQVAPECAQSRAR